MASVAVTGYTGFIGQHLVARLLKDGHIVYPVGRDMRRVECDRIYHLACPSTTKSICENPTGIMDIIFDVTRAALKINDQAQFIYASSIGASEIIDNSPQACYNVAKRSMEIYLDNTGRDHLSYRIPSVYGIGMSDDSFIKRCVDGRAWYPTDPNKMHYIAHVDDVVDAMVNLTEIKIEEITLGEIYEQFNSGRIWIHRSASSS